MAFVVEKIPRAAIEGLLSEHETYNGKKHSLTSRWAVDHSRNAFLALTGKVGGSYEGTPESKYFSLYWDERQIRFTAEPLNKEYPQEGAVMNWGVTSIEIPDSLRTSRKNVLELIQNALQAYGDCFNGDRYVRVNVRFDLGSTI